MHETAMAYSWTPAGCLPAPLPTSLACWKAAAHTESFGSGSESHAACTCTCTPNGQLTRLVPAPGSWAPLAQPILYGSGSQSSQSQQNHSLGKLLRRIPLMERSQQEREQEEKDCCALGESSLSSPSLERSFWIPSKCSGTHGVREVGGPQEGVPAPTGATMGHAGPALNSWSKGAWGVIRGGLHAHSWLQGWRTEWNRDPCCNGTEDVFLCFVAHLSALVRPLSNASVSRPLALAAGLSVALQGPVELEKPATLCPPTSITLWATFPLTETPPSATDRASGSARDSTHPRCASASALGADTGVDVDSAPGSQQGAGLCEAGAPGEEGHAEGQVDVAVPLHARYPVRDSPAWSIAWPCRHL